MPRPRLSSEILLETNVPLAVVEGWTISRLARLCHCGDEAASSALHAYRHKMRERLAADAGNDLDAMRGVVSAQRRLTTARIEKAGVLCDTLIAEAGALLHGQDCTGTGLQRVEGVKRDGDTPKGDALARLVLLDRVANILAKAVKTAEVSWNLCRSASGLAMAERLTEHKAKGKQGKDEGEVWEADFVLLEPTV
jgi:hypothetical protein